MLHVVIEVIDGEVGAVYYSTQKLAAYRLAHTLINENSLPEEKDKGHAELEAKGSWCCAGWSVTVSVPEPAE